jgi:hypothetical protein
MRIIFHFLLVGAPSRSNHYILCRVCCTIVLYRGRKILDHKIKILKIGDLWDHFLQPRSDLISDLKKGHLKDHIISFLDHFWNSKIFLLLARLLLSVLWLKTRKKQKLLHFSVFVCALVDFVVTMNLKCSFLGYGAVLILSKI